MSGVTKVDPPALSCCTGGPPHPASPRTTSPHATRENSCFIEVSLHAVENQLGPATRFPDYWPRAFKDASIVSPSGALIVRRMGPALMRVTCLANSPCFLNSSSSLHL